MTAPIASGWSESPGGPCTHWKAPPFHGARRIAVVPQAVSTEGCDVVLPTLGSSKFIIVDEHSKGLGRPGREVTRFYTKNGDALITACPEVAEIERGLLEWISDISGTAWVALDNRSIGISLNVTPPGGGFATHTDRNAITIVLFLNDADGGALHVYPAFPVLFGRELQGAMRSPWVHLLRLHAIKRLNTSRIPLAGAAHRLLFRPVRINPKAGTVAAFTKLSDHRVDPVAPGSLRVALVVAGDQLGVSFREGQRYYGYGQDEIMLGDLSSADQNAAAHDGLLSCSL
jgi:hypothetical protein